jgi:hypothetical protein
MCPDAETIALLEICGALHEFDCVDGDPKSYHTTPDGEMYRYVTLGYRGAELSNVSAALRAALQTLRQSLRGSKPAVLYRRSGPEIERDFESKDWKIRMRLAVPGADWSNVTTKPEGLPHPQA